MEADEEGTFVWTGVELEDFSDLLVNQLHDLYMEEHPPPSPISKSFYTSLPRLKGGAKGERCSICLEEYGKADICVRLPCGHIFHDQCVSKWFEAHHSCCTCRIDLPVQTETEKRQQRLEQEQLRYADALVNSAAAGAAGCPGSAFEMSLAVAMEFEAAHLLEEVENQDPFDWGEEDFQERLLERLVLEMEAVQLREELESAYRRRHNSRGSDEIEGSDFVEQQVTEQELRDLFAEFDIDTSEADSLEDLIALARHYLE